ncbi:hypothetical protein TUSST3_53340 [Streptomyces sp. TUS-ST3]|uniref:hypothetical protein n=1 Tax=Streptomyces sp. TUS-ST3 TaxID=3025591 RepID=UPI00235B4302|nr:hypothetical protein [Streptomyces sp. TUS-ST3]GLP68711.1 hypothetical protein TUSST3_53340 [Streptomyces sp. TUS-ST3]
MRGSIWNGTQAAVRLAEGAVLRDALFGAGDPAAWIALDEAVRHSDRSSADGTWMPTWQRTERGRTLTDALRRGEPLADGPLALALCHRDGRIRERALGMVAGRPELLPLVVVRCADWAEPVRDLARTRWAEAITVETAVALAPLALRIAVRHRGDFAVGLVDKVLRSADREALLPLLTHADRAVRRFVHRLAVEEGLLSPAELARTAARDEDTVVQGLCSEAALAAVAEGDADDDVLEPLLTARNPRARSAGVTALRRAGLGERAAGFLGDRAGLVRAGARYVVRQSGGDPVEWYRRRCATGDLATLSAGVVSGLAECGDRRDAESLWRLTSHPDPVVRTRAVGGLRALDVLDVPRLRVLLDDPAPGVVREATWALVPSARMLDAGWLLERLAVTRSRETRVSAFRLLNAHDGVVRLRAAAALVDDPDDKLRHWARQSVLRWRPTDKVPPGSAELGELLGRVRHLLGDHALEQRLWEAGLRA